jgi:SAM-dependent methyltransferase
MAKDEDMGVAPYYRTGEHTACVCCGSDRLEHLHYTRASKRELPGEVLVYITGCAACGAIFLNPEPTPEFLAEVYAKDGDWNHEQKEAVEDIQARIGDPVAAMREPASHTHLGAVWRRAKESQWREGEPIKVLDFGCGEGEGMKKFAALGWVPSGIDPATRHAITAYEMLDDIPTEPTFHIIFAKHVLEHTPNPLAVLRKFRAAVRPDGFIYCGQPCLDKLEESGAFRYCMNDPFHITGYTHRSIRQMLKTAGFEVEATFNLTRPDRFSAIARPSTSPQIMDEDALSDARAEFLTLVRPDYVDKPIRIRARLENDFLLRKKAKKLADPRSPEQIAADFSRKPAKVQKLERKQAIQAAKDESKARKAAKRAQKSQG